MSANKSFRPFDYGKRQSDLADSLNKIAIQNIKASHRRMIAEENVLSFRHGREWSSTHNLETENPSSLSCHSAEVRIDFKDIVDHKLEAIPKYLSHLIEQMENGFYRSIFSMMDKTTEKTGNIVPSSGNTANDFFDMLSKIEIGCDRYGRPTMPTIYTSPDNADKMLQELASQSSDFQIAIDDLKSRKENEAISRETSRLSRFRWR